MEKHYFLANGYDLGQVKIRNYNGRSAGRKVRLALAKYLHDFTQIFHKHAPFPTEQRHMLGVSETMKNQTRVTVVKCKRIASLCCISASLRPACDKGQTLRTMLVKAYEDTSYLLLICCLASPPCSLPGPSLFLSNPFRYPRIELSLAEEQRSKTKPGQDLSLLSTNLLCPWMCSFSMLETELNWTGGQLNPKQHKFY